MLFTEFHNIWDMYLSRMAAGGQIGTTKGFTHSTSYYIYITELSPVCKLYFSEIDILITLLDFKQ